MDWIRRSLTRNSRQNQNANPQSKSNPQEQDEERVYGITEELINFVKSFTIETFENFPLHDEGVATCAEETSTTSTMVRKDLSQWQERHATLLLSKVKEMSQLRYMLCPRHLKENQFWTIYFKLVRSHVLEYELRAVKLEKLKRMAMEDEKSSDNSAYEVEMSEAKHGVFIEPSPT